MSLTIEQSSDLERLVADLRTAEQRAAARQKAIFTRGAQRLRIVMQRVSHVKTGRMRASDTVFGPFSIGEGTLEAKIGPTVSYAIHEIERGGDHDYARRTLEEGQDIIDQTTEELGQAIVASLEGR